MKTCQICGHEMRIDSSATECEVCETATRIHDQYVPRVEELRLANEQLRAENARLKAAHGHMQQELSMLRSREVAVGMIDDMTDLIESRERLSCEVQLLRNENGQLKAGIGEKNGELFRLREENEELRKFADFGRKIYDGMEALGEAVLTTPGRNGQTLDSYIEVYSQQRDEIERLRSENARLQRFVKDSGTTYYSCETCGHTRTGKECLWCDRERLRAENETLRTDAERYRRIRNPKSKRRCLFNPLTGCLRDGENLDAAIDEAMKEAK